jgi:DNA-directed RNA polymerase specialized sigma24 family protein
MTAEASVTQWLGRLKAGDQEAATDIWRRYFEQLVRLARDRLRGARRRVADEEDVGLSAFESFCRRAREGRFPQLDDRHDLWRLLVVITARKALDLVNHERRLKRGGGDTRGESALLGPEGTPAIEQVLGREPTPEFACRVAEECRRLLDCLGSEELRAVALWKMEGYTNAQIAAKLDCVSKTVERKLRLIRSIWTKAKAHE